MLSGMIGRVRLLHLTEDKRPAAMFDNVEPAA